VKDAMPLLTVLLSSFDWPSILILFVLMLISMRGQKSEFCLGDKTVSGKLCHFFLRGASTKKGD